MQVKHTSARNGALEIRARSYSLTNGRVRQTKHYTSATIDWLAAYDPASGYCFYVPAAELRTGCNTISLRLEPARNNQRRGVRMSEAYRLLPRPEEVEPAGIEPATS